MYLDPHRERKNKLYNMKVTVILLVNGEIGTIVKGLVKGLRDSVIIRWVDPFIYRIFKIGWNPEKYPGDLKGIAVIQTPVKYQQLKLEWRVIILFTQPLRSGRIWHKVNFFKWSFKGL